MNRTVFITVAAMLVGAACAPGRPPTEEAEAVKQVIAEYYDTFFRSLDKEKYRSLLTDDYRLLEDGEILDTEGDIASMPHADSGYTRSDVFDFRSVQVHDDTAYAVYFLRSSMTDKKNGPSNREWLESAILRRAGGGWRIALLHSTRIVKPPH
jgi:ketosteroid isomerase-like protein